jgi:hypothetical protein
MHRQNPIKRAAERPKGVRISFVHGEHTARFQSVYTKSLGCRIRCEYTVVSIMGLD